MRNTLTLLTWAMQGLASADKARRERLTGTRRLTGADAMHVYLKENGIDVPRLDAAIKGLLQNGHTAAAIKDLATMAADAAADPKDLGNFVQKIAQCCAPTSGVPTAAPSPAAAPPGVSWTATWEPGKPPRFRPDLTSAARDQARAAASSNATPAPAPAPAANDPRPAAPDLTMVGVQQSPTIDPTTSSGTAGAPSSTVPIDAPPAAGESPRLAALKREMEEFEAHVKRELEALRAWVTTRLEDLGRRVDVCEARQTRVQAEIDRLNARVQQLEAQAATPADKAVASTTIEEPSVATQADSQTTVKPTSDDSVATARAEARAVHQTAPEVAPTELVPPPGPGEGDAITSEFKKTCSKEQEAINALAAKFGDYQNGMLGNLNATKAEIYQKLEAIEGIKVP